MSNKFISLITYVMAVCALSGVAYGQSIQEFEKALTSDDVEVRHQASMDAGQYGAEAVRVVAKYLESDDSNIRKTAKNALFEIVVAAKQPDGDREGVCRELTGLIDSNRADWVRRDALHYMGGLCGAGSVPSIARLLQEQGVAYDAAQALEQIPAEEAAEALADALDDAAPKLRAHLMVALAKRGYEEAIPSFKKHAESLDPAARWGALDALARLGVPPHQVVSPQKMKSPEDMARYTELTFHAADALAEQGRYREAEAIYGKLIETAAAPHHIAYALTGLAMVESEIFVRQALGYLATPEVHETVARLFRESDRDDLNDLLVKAYANMPPQQQAAILQILRDRDAKTLASVLDDALASDNPAVRLEAMRAAGEDSDPDVLYEVAAKGPYFMRDDALNEYMELAMSEGKGNAAFLQRIAEGPFERDARIEAIDAMAQLDESWDILAAIAESDDNAGVADAARRGQIAMLSRGGDKEKAVRDIAALVNENTRPAVVQSALETVQGLGGDPGAVLRELGYISEWQIIGPIPKDAAATEAVIDYGNPAPIVEVDGETLRWKSAPAQAWPPIVDLRKHYARARNMVAIALCEIGASGATDAELFIGSDDGCEVYLNGERVHQSEQERSYERDQDQISVKLKEGKNLLVLKVYQTDGDWQFSGRVSAPEGVTLGLPG